jgi:hypothetical protein
LVIALLSLWVIRRKAAALRYRKRCNPDTTEFKVIRLLCRADGYYAQFAIDVKVTVELHQLNHRLVLAWVAEISTTNYYKSVPFRTSV